MKLSISDVLQLIAILGLVAAVVYGILKFVLDFIQRESVKRENYYKSFDTVVAQLSSDVKTSQLSAAILMRRYFKELGKKKRATFRGYQRYFIIVKSIANRCVSENTW